MDKLDIEPCAHGKCLQVERCAECDKEAMKFLTSPGGEDEYVALEDDKIPNTSKV